MNLSYGTLTTVQFSHEYNTDSGFRFMRVTAPVSEAKKMVDMGLVLKNTTTGFSLFYDNSQVDRERFLSDNLAALKNHPDLSNLLENETALERAVLCSQDDRLEKSIITLELQLTDPYFFNYTGNLSDEKNSLDIRQSIFYFTNSPALNKAGADNRTYLHVNDAAGISETRALKKTSDLSVLDPFTEYPDHYSSATSGGLRKPFGFIKLRLLPHLQPAYNIRFQSLNSFWKYIIQTRELEAQMKELMEKPDKPAIINQAGKKAFTGPELIKLNNDKEAYAFTSLVTYPSRAIVKDIFRLVGEYRENDEKYRRVIINNLPVPDNTAISGITTADLNNQYNPIFSEIFL